MKFIPRGLALAGIVTAALAAAPAGAELPAPVRAMLDAAIASGNEADIAAVAKVARATNPAEAAEIDAVVADHRTRVAAAEEARKRAAGMFGGWHGSGELGGFVTAGNTDSIGVSVGVTLDKEGIQWRHKLRAAIDYQRSDGATTRNQWVASYEPNYKFNQHLYTYGLGMYEQDRFQGFSGRTTLSGGLGYRVIDDASATLDFKGGPSWRYTDWLIGPSTSKAEGLAGADLVWHLSPAINFTNNAQALWGSDDSTFNNLAAFTAKLSGTLSARLSYSWRHETDPPAGIGKNDTITRATLVYGF